MLPLPALHLLAFLYLGAGVVLTVCVPAFDLQCTCFRPVMYLLGTSWVFTFVMVLCDLMAHGLSQKHNVIYWQICGVVLRVGGTFIRQYQRMFYFVVGIGNESIKRAVG